MKKKVTQPSTSETLRNRAEDQLAHHQVHVDIQETLAEDLKIYHELQVRQIELEMQNEALLHVQNQLDESQLKFDNLIDFSPNGYFTLSPKELIYNVNQTGASLLGMNKEELVDMQFAKFIVPGDQVIFVQCQINLVKTREHQVCELRMLRADMQLLYVRLDVSLVRFQDDFQFLVIVTDITLLKQIEDTQAFLLGNDWTKTGKDFFEALAEYLAKTLVVDYVCIDRLNNETNEAQTVVIYYDGHFEDNIKYKLQDTPCGSVVGQVVCCFPKGVRHLFPKDQILLDMLAESYVGITLWGTDGKPFGLIAIISRKPMKDTRSAEFVLRQVSIRAVSELEHRQIEEKLKEREFFFRETQRAAQIGSFKLDLIKGTWESSEVLDQILGIDNNYIKNMEGLAGVCHPDDRNKFIDLFQKEIIPNQLPFDKEYRIVRNSDSNIRWVHVKGIPELSSENNLLLLVGTIHDITERKQIEESLIESEHRYRSLFEESSDALFLVDSGTGQYIDCNRLAETLTGYSREEIIRMKTGTLIAPFRKEEIQSNIEAIKSGQVLRRETEIVASDGRLIPVEFNSSLVKINKQECILSLLHDISDRKAAESALRESEQRYHNLFDTMIEGFCTIEMVFDHEGKPIDYRFLETNPVFEKLTGLHNVEGRLMRDLVPDNEEYWYDLYGKIALTGEPAHFEQEAKALGRYYEVSAYRIGMPEAHKVAILFNDITNRKKAEKELASSHNQLQSIIDNTSALVYAFDLEERFLIANKASADMLNTSPELLIGKTRHEFMPVETARWHEENDQKVIETDGVLEFEEYLTFDSGRITFLTSKFPLHDENKKIYAVAGISTEITQIKNSEEELRQSENRFRLALKNAPVSVAAQDLEMKFIWAYNQRTANSADIIGKTDTDIFAPEDALLLKELKQQVINTGEDLYRQLWITSNGKKVFIDLYLEPLRSKSGEITGIGIATVNLTNVKLTEEALHESEATLMGILNATTESIWLFSTDGRALLGNKTAWDRFGMPPEKIIGKTVHEFLPPELAESRLRHLQEVAQTGGPIIFEDKRADLIFEHNFYPITNSEGNLNRVAIFSKDITKRKRAEEILSKSHEELELQVKERTRELQKTNELLVKEINERKKAEEILIASQTQLRALTQRIDQIAEEERINVAREIHDELGHLLTVMKYDMESLANITDIKPELIRTEMESILNMLDSLIDTVRKISSELRPGILDHLGLFPAIEWQVRQFQKRTKIRCYFDTSDTDQEFDKNETSIIFRIIQETLTNIARHAKATDLWLSAVKKDDQFILKATDNGKGFDMNTTLRPDSLGLIGMRERALSIGGEIKIESAPGKGTTIALILKKK